MSRTASTVRPTVLYGLTAPESAEAFLRGQINAMVERGWEVHLGTTPGPPVDQLAEREKFTYHAIPMKRDISPIHDLIALGQWCRLVRRLRPTAVNMSTPKAGLLGLLAAFLLRVPKRVYIVRGLRFEGALGRKRQLLILMERATVSLATDVIAVSPSLADELSKHAGVPRNRVKTIGSGSSNGIDAVAIWQRMEAQPAANLRAALGVGPDAFVVGYIGRIAWDKGLLDLAEALGNLAPEVVLVTAGRVEDVDLAARMNNLLGRRWIRREWTSHVADVLAILDIFCLPTYREGMPNVVLEASAAGLPVITTTATGARDSVIDQVTGILVPTKSPTAIARAVRRLKGSADLRARMGAAGRSFVTENFASEQIWAELDRTYRSAVAGSRLRE